jgi:WD40 repeat protein
MTARHFAIFLIAAAAASALFPAAEATEFAFITTTDYSSGCASVVWLDPDYTTEICAAPIHSDAVARWYGGLIYVINREGADNIQILDPEDGFSTLSQYSTGNGTNPKDIAFVSPGKAFVSRYDSNDLLIMDPSTGTHLGTIDLSLFADGDGLCEMDHMLIKDGILFVSIQRIDRNNFWIPVGDSYVAVIDAAADTLIDTDPASPGVQAIPLSASNPYTDLKFDSDGYTILVSCVGFWGLSDGGIEMIDPASMSSLGFMITESAAGGDIIEFEILSADKGYMIIATPSFTTSIVPFDPSAGTAGTPIYSPPGWVLNDIEISPEGELFAADQTETAPGIRIWDTSTDTQITSSPKNAGLPPFQICFSVPASSAAELPAAFSLGANYPNPFNPSTTIPFSLGKAGPVEMTILDAAGRRIRTLLNGRFPVGHHEAVWNGMSDEGRATASGVYFVRMMSAGSEAARKIVLLR